MTTTPEQHKAMMADMKSFDEPMPAVGIFWYDPEEHSFFGVRKKEMTPKMEEEAAQKGLPFVNYQRLHYKIWQQEHYRALAKKRTHQVHWRLYSNSSRTSSVEHQ